MNDVDLNEIIRRASEEAAQRTGQIVRDVAEEAAAKAVKQTLLSLGISADDPLAFQADMNHLRNWRLTSETVKRQGVIAATGILVSGFLGLVWLMLRYGPPTPP